MALVKVFGKDWAWDDVLKLMKRLDSSKIVLQFRASRLSVHMLVGFFLRGLDYVKRFRIIPKRFALILDNRARVMEFQSV